MEFGRSKEKSKTVEAEHEPSRHGGTEGIIHKVMESCTSPEV